MQTVILTDNRPTKSIELPSLPGSCVVIYPSILVGDYDMKSLKDLDEYEVGLITFPKVIKEWNLTDESGKILEVNGENLKKLNSSDFQYLSEQFQEFTNSQKKS